MITTIEKIKEFARVNAVIEGSRLNGVVVCKYAMGKTKVILLRFNNTKTYIIDICECPALTEGYEILADFEVEPITAYDVDPLMP